MDIDMRDVARFIASQQGKTKPKPLAEAVVMRLREAAARYCITTTYKLGDVITPRADSTYTDVGEPHLVIEIANKKYGFEGMERFGLPDPTWLGEPGSTSFGRRHDVRILCLVQDKVAPFWIESAQFEHWTDPSTPRKPFVEVEDKVPEYVPI